MDADLSHSPSYLPQMVNLSGKYDLIVGSRYIKGGGAADWPLNRLLLSKFANIFTKILLSLPINDLTSGFKCIKGKVLENIDFATINSRGYAFQIEMVFRAFSRGFKIFECPIVFKGRKNEKSKMSPGIAVEAFLKIIFLFFKRLSGNSGHQFHNFPISLAEGKQEAGNYPPDQRYFGEEEGEVDEIVKEECNARGQEESDLGFLKVVFKQF